VPPGVGAREQLWAPRFEAFAKDGDLVLHADLPGVSLEDVDITLDVNVLTISGERKGTTLEEGASPTTSTSCPTALSAGA
jgi:HSP20 family protein